MINNSSEHVFSMAIARDKTNLTERQIRYYEQQELIIPERTKGNHRMYSENDILKLLEIKKLLSRGNSIAAVKNILARNEAATSQDANITDGKVRKLLKDEISKESQFGTGPIKGPFKEQIF